MHRFDYTFINTADDEKQYTDLLNKTFSQEYGYTLHDQSEHYCGYHSTLVCKHDGAIIGGISVYLSDPPRTGKLPMERRGVPLSDYVDISGMRCAEICRAGVLREYRKYGVYSELMKKCMRFCMRIGCRAGFWVARKYHSEFYKTELEMMGMSVRTLAIFKHTQKRGADDSITFDYYLSRGLFPD